MINNQSNLICFSSIKLSEPVISNKSVKSKVTLKKIDGDESTFDIYFKYEEVVKSEYLPLLRLASVMPLLNYGLFSNCILLDFPISKADIDILNTLNIIFSRDIFINKILRRRTNYILPEYLLQDNEMKPEDANPKAIIRPNKLLKDFNISDELKQNRCGVLSSGGKESLLTYGLLNEIGCKTFPLYVNESGGHWRTAIPAYRYHKAIDDKTQRVWTNIDRFYVFMLDNLKFIRPDHRKIWADTYPIRLCIFPFYIFLLLPIFAENKIGNLLIGSEFDDLRITPEYLEIIHYYGIYDQHQDFDIVMNNWFNYRMSGLKQWSAVRNISGLIVERILVKRYPHLAKYQRSCHSCHFDNEEIIPCGTCSKCMGILLFLLANNQDPKIMKFKEEDIKLFHERVNPKNLRLDEDEKNQSFYIIGKKENQSKYKPVEHVEKIHLSKNTCNINLIPNHLRIKLLDIIREYTTGYCILKNENWISIKEVDNII